MNSLGTLIEISVGPKNQLRWYPQQQGGFHLSVDLAQLSSASIVIGIFAQAFSVVVDASSSMCASFKKVIITPPGTPTPPPTFQYPNNLRNLRNPEPGSNTIQYLANPKPRQDAPSHPCSPPWYPKTYIGQRLHSILLLGKYSKH